MRRTVFALFLFGISFGYLEASVVVYLRTIYEPIRQKISPRPANELFPLITPEQLQAAGPEHRRRLFIELGREAATLFMLAGMGLAVAGNAREFVAAFLVAFGLWDIFFYLSLKILIDWPQSMLTWDLLFLIPAPWVGPVAAPVVVALSMVVCGLHALRRPMHIRPYQWCTVLLGGSIVIAAFCMDYPNISRGGQPNPFHWGVFALGELTGLAGFIAATRNRESRESRIQRGY